MKLATKLASSFALLILLLCGLGLLSIREMGNINTASHELAANWLPSIKAIAEVRDLTSVFRRLEMLHALTLDHKGRQAIEARIEEARAKLATAMQHYETLLSSAEERALYQEFQDRWREYLAINVKVMEYSRKNMYDRLAALVSGDSQTAMRTAQAVLEKLTEINNAGGAASAKAAGEAFTEGKQLVLIALALALVLAAGLAFWLTRNVLGQLGVDPGHLHAVANEVAGGNLDVRFDPPAGHGVYGVFIKMVDNLKAKIAEADQKTQDAARQTEAACKATADADAARCQAERARAEGMLHAAQQLENVVEVVTSASEELSAQIEQSSAGADEQSARAGETATAMEQMNATVLEVARNAGEASDTSLKARSKAEEGARVVGQVVAHIGQVKANARQSLRDMEALGAQAEGIGQILGVISDIADQTNLLALNAAIEAARAGDAGRGFAVVADEVRKLAEKTMTATKEVGQAIHGIQQGARTNIENVGLAAKAIEDMTALADTSGEALAQIVTLVDLAADQVRSIATAAEQQSATSDEINRSIEGVNRIAAETADAMRQSATAVTELARQAQILKTLIENMKSEGA
ncbi:methyl-accepting chemotaxis protein [Megalodesulfovibrio gigas]|uniref:Putative methyl-accepting chemotaxis sensory transducer n=1 Tax=Megalodesulfovibrio gigas (strain ATCC 19364 / DSM 1382 / NCIMB 9332 / VKM B-1759) TaxID=1121448 RepID=T2GDQ7_MEGG1|nr:methyl-accepting chemotaxis protein [Megalodesulfovibrio gigas]AGW14438.1 putative methyl-accepting chemotaxis sensory transducer [Megalodesulfovibrio gigas DSM 1382 = ATCC 19364]